MAYFPNLRTWSVLDGDGRPAQNIPIPEGVGAPAYMTTRNVLDEPKEPPPQAYIDTPNIIYSDWPETAGGIKAPLGRFDNPPKVALIGGGLSNCVAALELAKAGADVTLFEANTDVGGRCYSINSLDPTDHDDVYEMGAMRFPPSEVTLYWYARQLGFDFGGKFPDPGKVPTLVSFEDDMVMWDKELKECKKPNKLSFVGTTGDKDCSAPDGFLKVSKGFVDFMSHGVYNKEGTEQIFLGVNQLCELLQISAGSKDPKKTDEDIKEALDKVTKGWQKYLDAFDETTFLDGLKMIFGPNAKWKIPGGDDEKQEKLVWDETDFKKFAKLGMGSGGFGAFYTLGFNTIMRIVANGLENDQKMFTEKGKPVGIRNLVKRIITKATELPNPVKVHYSTYAHVHSSTPSSATVWYAGLGAFGNAVADAASDAAVNTGSEVDADDVPPDELAQGISDWFPHGAPDWIPGYWKKATYDYVLVGTTSKVAKESGVIEKGITPQTIRDALDIHMVASSKLFIRTNKFWEKDPKTARVILSDKLVPQLYTLDYGHPSYGVVLVDYAWEEDSIKIQDLGGFELYKDLFNGIKGLFTHPSAKPWIEWLTHLGFPATFDLNWIHWQQDPKSPFYNPFLRPETYGGWTLAAPGEDKKIQELYYDFQKVTEKPKSNGWSPVLLNGDCYGWIGGWTEGALQTALNNVSAIIEANGTLNAKEKSPSFLLKGRRDIYKYRPCPSEA